LNKIVTNLITQQSIQAILFPESFVEILFWGLNAGLAPMIVLNLFPGGVMQLRDVLDNGYRHARDPAYLNQNKE
jgi:nitric oxide reductase subunit B